MRLHSTPTREWSAISPRHQALARDYLARQIVGQGLDPTSAGLYSQLAPQVDLGPLVCIMAEFAGIVGVSRDRVREWHEDGRLPHAVSVQLGQRRFTLFWTAVAQTLRAYRDETDRPLGRGARYWP